MAIRFRPLLVALASTVTLLLLAAIPSARAATSTSYSGTTSDGASWIADVPSPWNGTLLLYSHGFGPPQALDAPDPTTRQALLNMGYALAGSTETAPGGNWWTLGSALSDQFQTLADVESDLPHLPVHVIAVGSSMGGLISELEAEHGNGSIDGALTTCGLVEGGTTIQQYQLEGEYAMSRLLAPGEPITLVHFPGDGTAGGFGGALDGLATGKQLDAIAAQAQQTPQGRARLALAMALLNVADWAPGQTMPAPHDYAGQEQQQYDVEFTTPPSGGLTAMDFVEFARGWVEEAAGGNPNWTEGVDFATEVMGSPYFAEVATLYHRAGLNLRSDLASLTAGENITADPTAFQWMASTSQPYGRLQVPELDLHTISDQLIPVQAENYYRHTVEAAGANSLLRQAFVERQGHCNFTPAEIVAGVLAIQHRVDSGRWDAFATPSSLEASATSLGLGDAAIIAYHPAPLTGVQPSPPRR